MSAGDREKSPLKRAASILLGAIFSGPSDGLEDEDDHSDSDSDDDDDDDIFASALRRKSRNVGTSRKRNCLGYDYQELGFRGSKGVGGYEDPNDVFEQARARSSSACSSLDRQADRQGAPEEVGEDAGFDRNGSSAGIEDDPVYSFCNSGGGTYEDPNDVFEQARASSIAARNQAVEQTLPEEDGEDVGLDDNAEDGTGEDDDGVLLHLFAGSPSRPSPSRPTRVGNHNKSDRDYWNACCSLPDVEAALSEGCKCGCVRRFSAGEVLKQRYENAEMPVKERRERALSVLRVFFSAANNKFSYRSHDGLECCRTGWRQEQGFTNSYVTRATNDVKHGVFGAHPSHGGDYYTFVLQRSTYI
jgi:hypothetical protein